MDGEEEEEMKAEHETKKSRKTSLKICKPFSLSFFVFLKPGSQICLI